MSFIHRVYLLTFLGAIILFSCQPDNPSEEISQYSIEQFMDNESVFGGNFSPDNSQLLFTSNRTGISNAYIVPVAGGEYIPVDYL